MQGKKLCLFLYFEKMFFFHFLWFLPPKGSKARYVFKMRSWPNFDLMVFSATHYFFFYYYFFWSISVVWHLHSIPGWVLSFCDFWLIATGKVLFQFLPWDYRRKLKTVNISQSFLGLCAIKNKCFPWKIISIGVICVSWNLEEILFSLKREHFTV